MCDLCGGVYAVGAEPGVGEGVEEGEEEGVEPVGGDWDEEGEDLVGEGGEELGAGGVVKRSGGAVDGVLEGGVVEEEKSGRSGCVGGGHDRRSPFFFWFVVAGRWSSSVVKDGEDGKLKRGRDGKEESRMITAGAFPGHLYYVSTADSHKLHTCINNSVILINYSKNQIESMEHVTQMNTQDEAVQV